MERHGIELTPTKQGGSLYFLIPPYLIEKLNIKENTKFLLNDIISEKGDVEIIYERK